MSQQKRDESTAQLHAEITKVIDRFRHEYDVTYATVIGTLDIIKMELWDEHTDRGPVDD